MGDNIWDRNDLDPVAADRLASLNPDIAAASAREQAIIQSVEGMLQRVERMAGRFDETSRSAIVQIAERALMYMARRDAINADIRDLFSFAKDIGFNAPAFRKAIADLRLPEGERKAKEAQYQAYRGALGIEGPDEVVALLRPATPVPSASKRITAKEKTFRDTMALVAASRIADAS